MKVKSRQNEVSYHTIRGTLGNIYLPIPSQNNTSPLPQSRLTLLTIRKKFLQANTTLHKAGKKINNIGSKINLNVRTFSSSEMYQLDLATFLEGSNLNLVSDIKDAILIWCNPTSVENNKIKFEIIIMC